MKLSLIFFKNITLIFSLLLISHSALAMSLKEEAKSAGLIGEKSSGYLGLVSKPASNEVIQLVKEINNKRKSKYQDIADTHKLPIEVIESQAGARLINKAATGQYIHHHGGWSKK